MWIGRGQNEHQVGENGPGILRRQTSSSICAAGDKTTLELDLGCSLWLKAFITLRRYFGVTLGIHMMIILPWAGPFLSSRLLILDRLKQ